MRAIGWKQHDWLNKRDGYETIALDISVVTCYGSLLNDLEPVYPCMATKVGRKNNEEQTVRQIKIIVEKHADGYVAYPLGLKGVVVGEGDTYDEALADAKSAIRFHLETFGPDIF